MVGTYAAAVWVWFFWMSVLGGTVIGVGQANRVGPGFPGKGNVVSVVESAPVGLRVDKDGSARRVPLTVDQYGSPIGMLCEQIGCQVVQLVRLAGGLDLWLDEEALVFLDLNDRAAVAAAVNPVATMIASRTAPLRQPILGVAVFLGGDGESSAGLSVEQLDELERLVALSTEILTRGDSLAAHVGGAH